MGRSVTRLDLVAGAIAVGVALLGAPWDTLAQSARSVADFNGDGADDLAVGAPDANLGKGIVGIFWGLPGHGFGFPNGGTQGPWILSGVHAHEHFGSAIAASDLDGNGLSELIVGAPGWNDGRGRVEIFTMGGPGCCGPIISVRELLVQGTGGVAGTASAGNRFGAVLAGGHFDNDRFGDFAVGAPSYDLASVDNAGAVHLFYGGPVSIDYLDLNRDRLWYLGRAGNNWVAHAGSVIVFYGGDRYYFDPAHVFHQDSFGVRDRSELGDWFGAALATGDFNGDGLADLAVGVPSEDLNASVMIPDAGAVAVLSGAPTVLSSSPNFFLLADSEFRLAGARFGAALSR